MATSARVTSIDALKRFRAALLRFCEAAARALGEAESEINRTLDWVEHTQAAHWQREAKTRTEDIASARAAVFRREMRAMTDNPGATEERHNLTLARARLRDAEEHTRRVKQWSRRLREEADRYHAMAERLSTAVHAELPEAALRLGRMIENLESYLAIAAPAARKTEPGDRPAASSAARGAAAGFVEEPRPWWAHLRERCAAIQGPAEGGAALEPVPPIDDADLASRLGGVALTPLTPQETIVVEQGALAGREFFLLRRERPPTGAPEWVIASTNDAPARDAVRLPAATVVAHLGPLSALLHLPQGWLAVVRDGRIRAVVDADDRERLRESEAE